MGERKDAGVVKSFVERDGEWLSWEGNGDLAGPYPPPLATAAEVASLRAEVERLKARVGALESDMATIQRLAEAGMQDEAVSEICALDDIYSVTQGLPLDEEG